MKMILHLHTQAGYFPVFHDWQGVRESMGVAETHSDLYLLFRFSLKKIVCCEPFIVLTNTITA